MEQQRRQSGEVLRAARLGRGLDALLPSAPAITAGPPRTLAIEHLRPGSAQPRKTFDEVTLQELSASIAELGILEPILVRSDASRQNGYEIVAGERRWRAAQKAGLREVPVSVVDFDDRQCFEAALVENLQRDDLNPVETARAFERLLSEHNHTQASLARLVGKERSTVANALRLLQLPSEALALIEQGELSEGHGRALLAAPTNASIVSLARSAAARRWSVRETERRARQAKTLPQAAHTTQGSAVRRLPSKSANVRDLERRLTHGLGVQVRIEDRQGKGSVVLEYRSLDQLDGLVERLVSR